MTINYIYFTDKVPSRGRIGKSEYGKTIHRRGPTTVPGRSYMATRQGEGVRVNELGARRPALYRKPSFMDKKAFLGLTKKAFYF